MLVRWMRILLQVLAWRVVVGHLGNLQAALMLKKFDKTSLLDME